MQGRLTTRECCDHIIPSAQVQRERAQTMVSDNKGSKTLSRKERKINLSINLFYTARKQRETCTITNILGTPVSQSHGLNVQLIPFFRLLTTVLRVIYVCILGLRVYQVTELLPCMDESLDLTHHQGCGMVSLLRTTTRLFTDLRIEDNFPNLLHRQEFPSPSTHQSTNTIQQRQQGIIVIRVDVSITTHLPVLVGRASSSL